MPEPSAPPLCAGALFALMLPLVAGPMASDEAFRAASVGPASPRGSMLGPDLRNTFSGAVSVLISTPMKQLLISSQFCGPQTTFVVGSGLNRLARELSKCVISCSFDPFGSAMGSAYW